MAGGLEVVTKFVADTGGLEAGAKKASDAIGGISPAAILAGGAIVGAASVAVIAIAGMTKAAADDRAEQEKLEQAVTNAGAATATSTQQINDAIAASQAKAFTDSETRDALASLVTATGDVTLATADLATAQDVARAAGVPLAQAADAVSKALAGSDGALTKLLPGLEKGATASDTLANAQKAAAGQADLFAASTEGQLQVATDSFSELGETIGGAFLPILDEIIPVLVPVMAAVGELVSILLKALKPAIDAVIAIVKIFMQNLDVIGPAFLVIGGILLATVIPAFVAWAAAAALAAAGTIVALAPVLIPILAIGVAVAALALLWKTHSADIMRIIGQVAAAFQTMGNTITGVFSTIAGWIDKVMGLVGDLLGAIQNIKLPSISLPSLPFSLAAPTAGGVGVSRRSGRAVVPMGATTVNVNVMSADPEEVMRAIRRWSRNNGGSGPFTRGLDRSTA
jgi:hypothetical protein